MGKLTVKKVKALNRPGSYGDGNNLVLAIRKSGAKFWLFKYARGGREHSMGLGPVHTVELHEARDAAHAARKLLREARDPIAEKRSARLTSVGARTFEQLARDFHAAHGSRWRNAKYRQQWLRTLENYVFPKIGFLPVGVIDTAAILSALKPIWESRYETARRVRNAIETVLSAAMAQGLRTGENPARWSGHLEHLLPTRAATEKKHHAAMPWREMPDFMSRLRTSPPAGSLALDALALEFLILTAARTNELRFATWDEIVDDVWIVPKQRMKTGREHRVPLSRRAIEVLAGLPRDGGPYLFPVPTADVPLSHSVMGRQLQRLGAPVTVHGFRSSFRDWAG